jgi:hypothetical protein
MAFQTGTQIRPELADADYSGFVNAANIRAQAMMNLGEQIGSGIREYQKNKTITATSLAQLEALAASNPDAYGAVKSVGGDLSKSISNIEKGDYKQRDVLAVLGGMQTYVNDQDRQRQVEAQEIEQKIKLAQLKELEAGRGTGVNLQSPKAYKTPDENIVYGAFDPSSNKVLEVGTDRELPSGSLPFSENGSSAGALSGKPVTMAEVEELRSQGYDPTIEFGSDGQARLTKMSPFSPNGKDEDAFQEAAQKKAGEAFGTAITEWQSGGAFQARKNLRSVDNAFEALASGSADTRTFFDFVPDIGGFRESARAFFNPTGQGAYDNVVSVVATTLREALGAAFTEKEGTRILNASYNPQLSTEQNLQRLAGISATISATIEAKDAQAEAFMKGEDWRSLPSPKEIFATNLAIYENVLQDKDRSIGIPATGSNVPATRIKSIKTGK